MPNGIMDGCQEVNEKVNLGRPNARRHDIPVLKDRFLKNPSKIQFRLHKLSASGDDKYVTKKIRVISLTRDMSTGPCLCLYQILSKYFKPLRSYEVHKNFA